MKEESGQGTFARDFGYLDKFLTGLAQHATTIPGERGARLVRLMSEEATRWQEIKQLLSGAGSEPLPSVPQAPRSPSSPTTPPPVAAGPAGHLTVGSLLGQPKK